MTKWLMVLLPLLLVPASGRAISEATSVETPDGRHEAMKALPALAGHWKGEGWIRQGPGEPAPFVGEEWVEPKLDGRILAIEGKHWTPDRSKVVHHAFAVLSYDPETKDYRFQTHVANGGGGDHTGLLEDGAFVWKMNSPGGPVRFTIRIEGDRWHEIGKIERNGQWYQFFEMTLQRVGS